MKLLTLFWMLLVSTSILAQTSRTDVLYKLDQTTVNVNIAELTDSDIVYTESGALSDKKRIARNQVWKVVFRDGSTEIITAPVTQTPKADQITLLDQSVVDGKISRRDDRKIYYVKLNDPTNTQYEVLLNRIDRIRYTDGREEVLRQTSGASANSQNETEKPVAASYTNPSAFSRLHLTVGPEFAYYPDPLNKDKAWLNDSTGFGMKQNIGASLRVDYLLLRKLGISLTAGYYGWELVRRYTRNGTDEYSETKKLTQIPVQFGIKVYPFGSFYLMPEGGVNLLFSSVKTSETHPIPANESVKSTPITYGGSLGYEIRARGLLLDLSLRYQLLNVNNLSYAEFRQSINEQVNIASFRLGIGFNALKK